MMNKGTIYFVSLLGACVLFLAGCAPSPTPLPETRAPAIPDAWQPFYTQKLDWEDCGADFECARATAPLNWENPEGETIFLSLIKHEATGSQRLGSLFVNPGGPGASGVDFIRNSLDFAVTNRVQEAYDVIGFDPRGVGKSSSVRCVDNAEQLDEFLFDLLDSPRGTPQWLEERQRGIDEYVQMCQERSGELLSHIDTESAAHDLDMLRSVVGDRFFNYVGYSYGSLLGAIYAEMFPGNVGRVVLDGALNPASENFDISLNQAIGFENALRNYLEYCLPQSDCPFTTSVDQSMTQIEKLLGSLDVRPLTSSDDRLLGADSMLTAIVAPLYSEDSWPFLTEIFQSVLAGDALPAWTAVDLYYNRQNGEYLDNSTEAFIAINCVDYPVSNDPQQWARDAQKLEEAAPVIGPYLAWGDQLCVSWPAQSKRQPQELGAQGSAPILVVGTTGDPATPYVWAKQLAQQLDNAYLLTFEGEGHTAYPQSQGCVDRTVDRYLLRGIVPENNARC